MKKLVLINEDFKDVYTGKMHVAGSREEMTEERISEITGVNPNFVSVIGAAKKEKEEKAKE